jgi:hypothetical protein
MEYFYVDLTPSFLELKTEPVRKIYWDNTLKGIGLLVEPDPDDPDGADGKKTWVTTLGFAAGECLPVGDYPKLKDKEAAFKEAVNLLLDKLAEWAELAQTSGSEQMSAVVRDALDSAKKKLASLGFWQEKSG